MIFYCFLVYVCRPQPIAGRLLQRRIPYCGGAFRLFQSKQESERRSGWRGSGRTAAKIVETESRISSLLEYYAEVQPILCKVKQINWNSPT